ncbi:MAG TPA: sigma factor, partial [Polyangiaceae bacterium]|nr:sigma factor [Polyangiaceae bacterium]
MHHPSSSAEDPTPSASTALWAQISERELFGLVYRCVRTLVSVEDRDFEDLVQAAATEVWRARETFQGRSELASWVYGVCYRVL